MTRTYDDFEWLQQSLFSQEDVPGIQGVIVSPALCSFFLAAAGPHAERWSLWVAWSSLSAAPELLTGQRVNISVSSD